MLLQEIVGFAFGTIGTVYTGKAVLTTVIAGESALVEVKIVLFALVANRKVIAIVTDYLARLAGFPWELQWESTQGTRAVAIELVVVLRTGPQAHSVTAVPPQTSRLRRVVAARLS